MYADAVIFGIIWLTGVTRVEGCEVGGLSRFTRVHLQAFPSLPSTTIIMSPYRSLDDRGPLPLGRKDQYDEEAVKEWFAGDWNGEMVVRLYGAVMRERSFLWNQERVRPFRWVL